MSSQQRLTVESVERVVRGRDGVCGVLELPKPDASVDAAELLFAGWAFGTVVPVLAIEFACGDEILAHVEPAHHRPDVATAFPDQRDAGASGFRARVGTERLAGRDVIVRAVLADGATASLARVQVGRGTAQQQREPSVPAAAPAAEPPVLDPSDLPPPHVGDFDLSTAEALRRVMCSPAMRWAKLIHDDPPPGTAWQRISDNQFFEPLLRPGFEIMREDRVFAMGSCFARGVEGALAGLSIDVVSRTKVFDHFPTRAVGWPHDFTNKYNTEAIRNELRWALEPGALFPDDAPLQLPEGVWQDPFASANLEFADLETTLERHRLLTNLTSQVSKCRIVVITLGLIETFLDTKTGLYTNGTPHLTAAPERYRFRILSFEQVMEGLEDVHSLLSTHGHPDVQIVVTVSPVPAEATFTGQDVVLANTLSKSTLRAAAGAWTMRHENVHYFPSYEIVMNSDRAIVWEKDGRHVRPSFVRQIMDVFLRTHLKSEVVDVPALAKAS